MKKTLINWMGLIGILSIISFVAAVIFSPIAYPGYDWMSQAVSDLSSVKAPSKLLWSQISAVNTASGIVLINLVCIYIQGKLNKTLRLGIYLFCIMNWISSVGYQMFPLVDAENLGGFQDTMHLIVTALVVLSSIISLVLIIVGGYRKKSYVSLASWALLALVLMFIGAISTGVVPKEYFGIAERFSVFSAVGFNTVLGMYLFTGFKKYKSL